MKYRIKQKLFSLTDSFTIDDDNGQPVYTAKGKVFSISSSQTLYDAAGREVLKVKRKYLSLLPACRLVNADGTEWLIRKKFWPFWTTRFSVSTPEGNLEINGNLWQHEYEIREHNRLLASVSKKWFSWSDSYGVNVYESKWTPQLLAAVIVIDRIQHKERNSNFSD